MQKSIGGSLIHCVRGGADTALKGIYLNVDRHLLIGLVPLTAASEGTARMKVGKSDHSSAQDIHRNGD